MSRIELFLIETLTLYNVRLNSKHASSYLIWITVLLENDAVKNLHTTHCLPELFPVYLLEFGTSDCRDISKS